MAANMISPPTPVERAFAEAFEARKALLPGGDEVTRLREKAFDAFAGAGLPHRRVEAWHYTDLRAMMRNALPIVEAPDAAAIEALRPDFLNAAEPGQRLVLVDGVFAPELSSAPPPGVAVRSLASVLSEGRADLIALLAPQVAGGADPVLALNAALMQDGIVIEVAPGATLAAPLCLIHATASAEPAARFSRSLIVVGAGASLRLFESSHKRGARAGQIFNTLVAAVGEGATLNCAAMMTGMEPGCIRAETLIASLGAGARFDSFALVAGGGVTRRQIYMRFEGPGAEGSLRGASLLRGREHADTTLVVEHLAPDCSGRQLFKHILDEEATGVFQGRIEVAPLAQKTDARMLSKALLLSDMAVMNNKPELEIFADDVACGHGATSGGLDDNQLFYLQSRGLPFSEAEALLLEAFVGELIDDLDQEDMAEAFRDETRAWLSSRTPSDARPS